MKSIQKKITAPAQKNITICFDIDGCLALLNTNDQNMPEVYKQAMLGRFKEVFFGEMLQADQVSNAHITLRLFTNRKDICLDKYNSNLNTTPNAKAILADLKNTIQSWLHASSTLIMDDRLHIEQVFDNSSQSSYDDLLATISTSSSRQSPTELYAGGKFSGENKVDLVTSIFADHAHSDHTHDIFFIDDRLNPDHPSKGLDTLQAFFQQTPQVIPKNCKVNMVQFDPFIDQCKHFSAAKSYMHDHKNQANRVLRQSKNPNKLGNFPKKIIALIIKKLCSGVNVESKKGFKAYAAQQEGLCLRASIQGTGTYPQVVNKDDLWHKILIPVGEYYQVFLANKSSHPYDIKPLFMDSITNDDLMEWAMTAPVEEIPLSMFDSTILDTNPILAEDLTGLGLASKRPCHEIESEYEDEKKQKYQYRHDDRTDSESPESTHGVVPEEVGFDRIDAWLSQVPQP